MSGQVQAADLVIEEIRFIGNEHTEESILLQEMSVKVGDVADEERIAKSRQAIMDLGLFKSADINTLPGEQGVILEVAVSEKHYFFPIPKLNRDADGEISYGVQLRFDNLGGLNQRMRLTLKNNQQCCGQTGDEQELSLSYYYPRLKGSVYGLSIGGQLSRRPEQVGTDADPTITGRYDRSVDGIRIVGSRWLLEEGPSAGWRVNAGVFYSGDRFTHVDGEVGLRSDRQSVGLVGGLEYGKVHDYLYSREGAEYGYELTLGLEGMGSDHNYSIHSVHYRRYWPIGDTEHQALHFQMRMGTSGGNPGIDAPFSLGGSNDLRGYEKSSLEGRSYFSTNTEFLRPIVHPAFRGVVFMDIGNTYPDSRMIDFGDLEYGGGLGFRYKFKMFVDVQLRFDLGWALGDTGRKAYVGTKHSF